MQQKAKDLDAAGVKLIVVVGDEDSAQYAYGVLSPASDPTVALVDGKVFDSYKVAGVPANLLVAPDSRVVLAQLGWSEELLQPWLDAAKSAMQAK